MRLYYTQQDVLSYNTNELFPGIVALDNSFVLAQILECVQQVVSYTEQGRKAFFSDSKTQDAVIRFKRGVVQPGGFAQN